MNEIRFIDLFSGVGGYRLGLEKENSRIQGNKKHDKGSEGGWERGSRSLLQQTRRNSLDDRDNAQTQSNFRCVWSCDNNKHANQIYIKQFGKENHYSTDIRGVDPEKIPDFDILCAGFPCPSFSVAGKGKGFQDPRGTLFFEISRIAEAKRPQILFLENVRGILSNDRGQTFQTILQELGRIGYWVEWQVFNSKHHGVPQDRKRVFFVGHLRNGCPRPIFPITESNKVPPKELREREGIASCLDSNYWKGARRQRTFIIDTFNRGVKEGEAYSLKTNPSITSSAVIALQQVGTLGNDNQARRIYSPNGLSPTIPTPGGGHHMPKIIEPFIKNIPHGYNTGFEKKLPSLKSNRGAQYNELLVQPVLTPDRAKKRQHGRRFKEAGDPAFTLTGQDIHGIAYPEVSNIVDTSGWLREMGRHEEGKHGLTDYRIRRLTPLECERLQGFPDGWTAHGICKKGDIVWTGKYRTRMEINEDGSEIMRYHPIMTKAKSDGIYPICDTNRYKCLGNAVTVNVIEFLGERILSLFTNESDQK